MKGFMRILTNGDTKVLVGPLALQVIQSLLQGIPFYTILMVILEFVKPIESPGSTLNVGAIVMWTGVLVVALILLFIAARGSYIVQATAAYSIACEGRLALGEHLRRLSMGFIRGKDPGDITALMLQDYANIETMLSHMLMDALSAIALPLVFVALLFPLDWRMTLVTVAFVPLALVVLLASRKVVLWLGAKQIRSKNEASSRMLEYLDGMKNIKSHNLQGEKFTRLERSFSDLKKKSIRLEASGGPTIIVGSLALYSGIALIIVFGAKFVVDGSLSISNLLFFLIMGTRMYDPLNKLLVNFIELSYYSVSMRRIKEVLEADPLPEPTISAPPSTYDIEFRDVTFRYHEKDVIKGASFSLKPGTMTALVGPSGSGKSTITRLIARFWDVNKGQVLVGGESVSTYSAEDLLSSMSMVFQDVYLFNDTILANIRVGRPDASVEEVMEAARKARCHDFISRLPAGYESMVGEGGSTLSGGEKQRISIARAILKDAPIVLLDEATASLDPENELYIQEAIAELVEGRSVIVIAHRLSTITKADQILVLKEGSIVQSGRHDALLSERDGLYATMWNEQSKAHAWKVRRAA